MSDQKLITVNKSVLKKKWDAKKGVILGTALAVTAVIAAAEAYAVHQHNDFLKEKDLYDEYYDMSDDVYPDE
jgi:hypothetical protein